MTFHGADIRQPVVIGRAARGKRGTLLNLVEHPVFECPECWTGGPLEVYVKVVRWPCGHTRSLPPIRTNYRTAAQQPYYLIRSVA